MMNRLAILISVVVGSGSIARGEDSPSFTAATVLGASVDNAARTITSIAPESPAARAGLRVGDRIEKIGANAPGDSYEAVVNAQLARARKADSKSVTLKFRVVRGAAKKSIELTATFREIDTLVAVNRALDYLAKTSAEDPEYKATKMRSFYAPIIYAPLTGLAFVVNGSTRSAGRHSAGIRRVLDYVMKHGGVRKPGQDIINKAVGGNICSLTHNAGFTAMFLAQLLDAEKSNAGKSTTGLAASDKDLRARLAVCCRTLEKIALPNGGWQHGSGGRNMLGYTHLTAATITAVNGLSMAKQVGIKVDAAVLKRGLAYLKKATSAGMVGYAVGNRGSFSAGRNAGYLQCLSRNKMGKDKSFAPVLAKLLGNLEKAGTGHGSPIWHLFYVSMATARLDADAARRFAALYRKRLIAQQQADGSIRAFDLKGSAPGKGEENRVWGALYTTPLISMSLLAPYRQNLLLYSFGRPQGS